MDSLFSSDTRALIALPEIGFVQLVDVDITVQFDGKLYSPIVRACLDGGVPAIVSATGIANPLQVLAICTAYATAAKLVKDIGIPKGAVEQILGRLEHNFAPALKMWLEDTKSRVCHPQPDDTQPIAPLTAMPVPQPVTPVADPNKDILVSINRDVSGIFSQKDKTFRLEYTLFNEPKVFRCILACHRGDAVKMVEFRKKNIFEIIQTLNGDSLAFEIASYFGDTDTHKVHLVSAVLKLGFAMNTKPTPPASAPETSAPKQTVLPRASKPNTFTVFNGGSYFEVPEPA